MLHIEIPPEVRQYHEKLIAGLTARQVIAVIVTLAICVPLYWFGRQYIPTDILGWLIIIIALPLGAIGFFKYNGMTLEKLLVIIAKFEILFPQRRRYKSVNAFSAWQAQGAGPANPSGYWQKRKYAKYARKTSLEKAYLLDRAWTAEDYGFDICQEELLAADNPLLPKRKLGKGGLAERKRRLAAAVKSKKKGSVASRNKAMELMRKKARTVAAAEVANKIPYVADYGDGLLEVAEGRYSKMYLVGDLPYAGLSGAAKSDFIARFVAFFAAFPQDVRVSYTVDKDMDDGLKRICFTLSVDAYLPVEGQARFLFLDRLFLQQAELLGCAAKAVSSEERIAYYHDKFRKGRQDELVDAATGTLKVDLAALRKSGTSPKDLIMPSALHFNSGDFVLSERRCRVLYLNNLPRTLADSFLADIAGVGVPVIITVNCDKLNLEQIGRVVAKRSRKSKANRELEQRAERIGYTAEGIQHDIRYAAAQAEDYINEVRDFGQELMLVSVLLLVSGADAEELEANSAALSERAQQHLCTLQALTMQQVEGLKCVLPFGYASPTLSIDRTLTSGLLAAFMPFWGEQ